MLLSVKGMSAEKVSAILDTWETPRDIWDALKARHELSGVVEEIGEESQKKKKVKVRGPDLFFADTVQGEGRRKVGDALSKEVSPVVPEQRKGLD
jgi:crossover junction endonuclease MUS81